MTGLELLEAYPKAASAIGDFYHAKLIASMDTEEITEEFKEMLKQQSFDNEYVATFINENPRFLFDVFDANKIYITTPVSSVDGYFRWEIVTDVETWATSEFLKNRKEAEAAAVEEAFQILNEKL